ncbi:MAG: DUF1761 domain-containing protein [Acidobacteria bacterium]|nr:DUF1761 domain-containing protein [Acidobacteriota bacterium]
MFLTKIPFLAIFLCGVVNLFMGFLWYNLLFLKPWKDEMKWTKKEEEAAQKKAIQSMVLSFIGSLIMGFILANLFAGLGIISIPKALLAALLIWIGFEAISRLNAVLFERASWKLYWIDATFDLAVILGMAVVIILI